MKGSFPNLVTRSNPPSGHYNWSKKSLSLRCANQTLSVIYEIGSLGGKWRAIFLSLILEAVIKIQTA